MVMPNPKAIPCTKPKASCTASAAIVMLSTTGTVITASTQSERNRHMEKTADKERGDDGEKLDIAADRLRGVAREHGGSGEQQGRPGRPCTFESSPDCGHDPLLRGDIGAALAHPRHEKARSLSFENQTPSATRTPALAEPGPGESQPAPGGSSPYLRRGAAED